VEGGSPFQDPGASADFDSVATPLATDYRRRPARSVTERGEYYVRVDNSDYHN
jgi:hypothetical protein